MSLFDCNYKEHAKKLKSCQERRGERNWLNYMDTGMLVLSLGAVLQEISEKAKRNLAGSREQINLTMVCEPHQMFKKKKD